MLHRDAPITATDPATRTVTARLVTYNDPRDVVDRSPAGPTATSRPTRPSRSPRWSGCMCVTPTTAT